MGCSQSEVKSTASNEPQPERARAIRFAPQVQDDTSINQPDNRLKQQKNKSKSRSKSKSKGKDVERKEEKENTTNTTKVKKAHKLRHKPQHDKFISDILEKSRAKLIAQHPELPKDESGFTRPVIEYSASSKGKILPNEQHLSLKNRWNQPISESVNEREGQVSYNSSYVSINESSKSPFRQRQIDQRIQDIRKGRRDESIFGGQKSVKVLQLRGYE